MRVTSDIRRAMKTLFVALLALLSTNAFASEKALFLYNTLKEAGIAEKALPTESGQAGNTVFWQSYLVQDKVSYLSCASDSKEGTVDCSLDLDINGKPVQFSSEASQKLWKLFAAKNAGRLGNGISAFAFASVECKVITDSSLYVKGKPSLAERTSCVITKEQEI